MIAYWKIENQNTIKIIGYGMLLATIFLALISYEYIDENLAIGIVALLLHLFVFIFSSIGRFVSRVKSKNEILFHFLIIIGVILLGTIDILRYFYAADIYGFPYFYLYFILFLPFGIERTIWIFLILMRRYNEQSN